VEEKAFDQNGNMIVAVDRRYFRPAEVETLLGDSRKAMCELDWSPRIAFDQLISEMVESDLRSAERDALAIKHGFQAFNVRER
jgi:GDPmannose 4,6-dehydratase